MKSKIKYFAILLLFLFLTSSNFTRVLSQSIGNPVKINPAIGYEYTTVVSGHLTWPEGKIQYISLNFTLNQIPDNLSKIEIQLITFEFIGKINDADQVIDRPRTQNPEISLTNANSSTYVNQSLEAPSTADNFYLNITLFSRTVGNITQGVLIPYAVRFPEEGTILVDRDKLVPLINLYGFPPDTFFTKWLPVYGSLLFILLVPSLVVGISKISQKRVTVDRSIDEEKTLIKEDDVNE